MAAPSVASLEATFFCSGNLKSDSGEFQTHCSQRTCLGFWYELPWLGELLFIHLPFGHLFSAWSPSVFFRVEAARKAPGFNTEWQTSGSNKRDGSSVFGRAPFSGDGLIITGFGDLGDAAREMGEGCLL